MSDFEEKNAEEKAEVAEDGWTAVKGKGTTRRTEEEQNEMKAKAAKKRKKGQLVSISKIKITGRLSFFVNSTLEKCQIPPTVLNTHRILSIQRVL